MKKRNSALILARLLGSIVVVSFCSSSLSCGVLCNGPCSIKKEWRPARDIIESGEISYGSWDGIDYIHGPKEVVDFIWYDSYKGKKTLISCLNSDKKGERYFAVVALTQIGDLEARRILWDWVQENEMRDRSLCVIIAVRLIYIGDFRVANIIWRTSIDEIDKFAISQIRSMAERRLHLVIPSDDNKIETKVAFTKVQDLLLELLSKYRFLTERATPDDQVRHVIQDESEREPKKDQKQDK